MPKLESSPSKKNSSTDALETFPAERILRFTGRSTSTRLKALGGVSEDSLRKNLSDAAWAGNLPLIQALVAMTDPGDVAKSSALIFAVGEQHMHCISFLLSVCDPALDSNAALFVAAELGSIELIQILLPVSPIINTPDSPYTALVLAAEKGHLECVKLLSGFYDPRSNQSLALARAAGAGQADCLRFLIPLSDPCANFSTAISMAIDGGHFECVDLLMPFLLALPVEDIAEASRESAELGRAAAAKHLRLIAISIEESRVLELASIKSTVGAKGSPSRL